MKAQDERNQALRERAEDWREEGLIDVETQRAIEAALPMPWRTYGVVAQCVFFILTAIGMGATYAFLHEHGVIAGVIFIGIAELLIFKRWFHTGVESALWIGGLLSMITELPRSGTPEALLVIAAACALAGARVRNPVFGAVAAGLVVAYAETKWDLGVIAALAFALAAALALLRAWRRPSTEWLWILIAITLPAGGSIAIDARWQTMSIALYATFGLVMLALGFAKRHHAHLIAGMVGITVAAAQIADLIDAPLEGKLGAAGAFLLALAFLATRALRARTTGLVVTPAKLTRADDALAIAGALAARETVRTEAPPQAEVRPQGEGGFGGAGASGNF